MPFSFLRSITSIWRASRGPTTPAQVERFAGTLAADDDCTVLDVRYLG